MEQQIPKDVNDARLQALQAVINAQQLAFNQATVGRDTTIMIERRGKLPGQWIGKSPWLQSVHLIDPTLAIGDFVDVRLATAGPNSLAGEPIPMPVSPELMNAA